MKRVTIMVTGSAGVGKSTIAYKIKEFLDDLLELDIDLIDEDDGFFNPIAIDELNKARLNNLKKDDLEVVIRTVQTGRSSHSHDT